MKPVSQSKRLLLLTILLALTGRLLGSSEVEAVGDLSPLRSMFEVQKSIHALSASFTQTKALKTLRDPLVSKGRFWMQKNELFRWELGSPAKTIVIGSPLEITVIQPFKKTASKVLHQTGVRGKDSIEAMGIIALPGNGDFDAFQKAVHIQKIQTSADRCHVEFIPKESDLAQGLTTIKLDFNPQSGKWISLEFVTKDGSSVHSDFSDIRLNPKLDQQLFQYDLNGYRISNEKK